MAGTSAESEIARKTWELENDIETIPASDEIFRYDTQEQQQFLSARRLFGFHFNDSHTHTPFDLINLLFISLLSFQDHGTKILITSKTFKYRPWLC